MDVDAADPEVRRHWLLVVATGEYADKTQWHDLDVDAEVTVWKEWLCAPDLDQRRFQQLAEHLAHNPSRADLNGFFDSDDLTGREGIGPNDAVVMVVTGHGIVADGSHRIVLTSGDSRQPNRTMVRTDELIGALRDTQVEHAFIVVDTCEAGAAGEAVLRYDSVLPPTFTGLLAASPKGTAQLGAVADAVRAFLTDTSDKHGGPNQEYFTAQALMNHIANRLGDHGQRLVPLGAWPYDIPTPCLPNPRFTSTHAGQVETAPAIQNLALRVDDLEAHWGPRARGVQRDDEPGWLFTGRARLTRSLLEALQGPPKAVLLTGAAGSGKSAVLSRLVTLSDPEFRARHADLLTNVPADLRPPLNAVDVAIHAQGKTPVQILDQLIAGLNSPGPAASDATATALSPFAISALASQLGERLDGRDTPPTIIIDALDEATDPKGTLRDVIAPLSADWRHPRVRLIIGVRSPTPSNDEELSAQPAEAGTLLARAVESLHGEVVRVDAAPMWEAGDLSQYLLQVMLSSDGSRPSVYAGREELARRVADRLADAVAPSYLVGQIVARSLAAADEPRSPDDSEWLDRVQAGLGDVLNAEIETAFSDPRDRARATTLLLATALSFGRGLPWTSVWPAVASALSDHAASEATHSGASAIPFSDDDISWLLASRIGGYLVRDLDDGITVYRPFHDALRSALNTVQSTSAPGALPQELLAGRHRAIARALENALTPASDTGNVLVETYTQKHLGDHAAAGNMLEQLLRNPRFLTFADPSYVLPLLGSAALEEKKPSAAAVLYRQTATNLIGRTPPARTLLLQLGALQAGERELADELEATLPPGYPWRIAWSHGRPTHPHVVIQNSSPVTAIVAGRLGHTTVVAAGGSDGAVRVWDASTGALAGAGVIPDAGIVTAAAWGEIDGSPALITGTADGVVRFWDPATGLTAADEVRFTESSISGVAVTSLEGRPAVVIGTRTGEIHTVDLERRTVSLVRRHTLTVREGDEVVLDGRTGTAVHVDDEVVWVEYREDLHPSGFGFHSGPQSETIFSHADIDFTELDGRLCTISRRWDGTVDLFEGLSDVRLPAPFGSRSRETVETVETIDDRAVILTTQGTPTRTSIQPGRSVVHGGGGPHLVVVSDFETGEPIGPPLAGHTDPVTAVTAATVEDRRVVVTGSADETIRIWDPVDDQPSSDWHLSTGVFDDAFQIARVDGKDVIVGSPNYAAVGYWDLATGQPIGEPLEIGSRQWAFGLVDGDPLLAAENFPDLAVWSLARRKEVGRPQGGSSGFLAEVAIIPGSRPRIASVGSHGEVGVWDAAAPWHPVGYYGLGDFSSFSDIASVCEAADGLFVVSRGQQSHPDRPLRVWRLAQSRRKRRRLFRSSSFFSQSAKQVLAAPPASATRVTERDGGSVLLAAHSAELVVWDLDTASQVGTPFVGHAATVRSIATTKAGTRDLVVSCGDDETVRVWDFASRRELAVANLGLPLREVRIHGTQVVVSSDAGLTALELDLAALV